MNDAASDNISTTAPLYDIVIVGGGINGAGIARDAVGRGLKVALVEQRDLAQATSSASTKLIHGGLRYLEHYEFRLVREALKEREVLLKLAPHLVRPMQFVLPHVPDMRPAWMVRLGLFLYDHLGGRETLPASRRIDLRRDPVLGGPLQSQYRTGFTYADCWVDDARLVVLNALDAHERGAKILTRHRCRRAWRQQKLWTVEIEGPDGAVQQLRARILVNAAGPWAGRVAQDQAQTKLNGRVKLVKGSHIVVPGQRPDNRDFAYIFQNDDRRIVFAIPYEDQFTLIGTTDTPYEGDPYRAALDDGEADYLCRAASRYFAAPIQRADIVWSYAGVRPLYDDGAEDASAITRDYVLEVADENGAAPILSVLGGKLTTYRRLAESAMDKLQPYLPDLKPKWTAQSVLPGGDITDANFNDFLQEQRQAHAGFPPVLVARWARSYGMRMEKFLQGRKGLNDLGQNFGHGLTEAEVDYLRTVEWARDANDILWRRSKLGLHLTQAERDAFTRYMDQRVTA